MLKLVENGNSSLITGITPNNIIKTRILCYAICYGFDKSFVDFWHGEGITVARFDDVYTIWAEADADIDELKEFINMMQIKSIITNDYVSYALGFDDAVIRSGFKYDGKAVIYPGISLINENNIKKNYSFISESIPGSFNADSYLEFLSDFTYRKNRGFARGICFEENGEVIASALTASETPESVIISGIASSEKYRGSGLGRKIVSSITGILQEENKSVFVVALNDSAIGFYKHIGFTETEKIAYITLQ